MADNPNKDQEYTVSYDPQTDEFLFTTTITIRHKLQQLLNERDIGQINLNKTNLKLKAAQEALEKHKAGGL